MKLIWSPVAVERAREISDFIGSESQAAARQWLLDLFGVVERLEQFPHSGRVVAEVGREDIREVIWGKYRIIYRLEPEQISILTVQHGRKQVPVEELTGEKPGKKRRT